MNWITFDSSPQSQVLKVRNGRCPVLLAQVMAMNEKITMVKEEIKEHFAKVVMVIMFTISPANLVELVNCNYS